MRRRVVAYLDQSDISYLAMGRGPGGADYAGLRARLQRLSESGQMRVRTSFAHLAESLRLRWRSRRAVLDLLGSLRDATFVCNFPYELWQAELAGREPEIREARISTAGRLFWLPFLVTAFGERAPSALHLWVRRKLRDELKDGLPMLEERDIRLIMQDDAPPLLNAARAASPIAALRHGLLLRFQRHMWGVLERRGYESPWDGVASYRQGTHGFGQLDREIRGQLSAGTLSAESMPSVALSVAIKRSIGKDLGRDDLRSDDHDTWHATYAAYCDAATVDRRVFDATKEVRKRLPRPRWYRTGTLQALLDDVETGSIHGLMA